MSVKATDRCGNCGEEFTDHVYVLDSITQYKCRTPHVESGYGRFKGGEPSLFFPDYECCTAEEIANWKAACEGHGCAVGSFGIGVYTLHFDRFFTPADEAEEHDE